MLKVGAIVQLPDHPSGDEQYSIRMVTPQDLSWLGEAIYQWPSTYRWSTRGLTLSPDTLSRLLWDGVAVQYVITDERRIAVGLLQIHQLDLQSSFAHLSILAAPQRSTGEDPFAPLAHRFITQIFRDFPLRKLYVEVLEDEIPGTVARLGWSATEEARLRQHERRAVDEYCDLVYYTVRNRD
jgi:hypothetical protein